jgi:hypothetical protein
MNFEAIKPLKWTLTSDYLFAIVQTTTAAHEDGAHPGRISIRPSSRIGNRRIRSAVTRFRALFLLQGRSGVGRWVARIAGLWLLA